jgi:hypothetical protein
MNDRAPSAREAAAQRQQLGDSERDGPAGPCLSAPAALATTQGAQAPCFSPPTPKRKSRPVGGFFILSLAERGGFEPPIGYELTSAGPQGKQRV